MTPIYFHCISISLCNARTSLINAHINGVIVLSAEMFFALMFGLIAFKEMPATKEVIGGLFIMAAVVIPNIEWKKTKL